jgi:type IV secretory pathway VirB10-like protein
MTYKSSVEKSELLLDSLYLEYENDDSFRSVKDENDQSVRTDQSVKMRDESSADENSEDENSDSENSEDSNHQKDNLTETPPSAASLIEMQPVRGNLTPPPADSSQPVKVDQAAPLHAAENDDDLSVLMSDSKSDEMINHQSDDQAQSKKMINQQETDNRLISEENNSLILNYSRPKVRHDYKQLHHKDFVKAAKIGSIESVAEHGLVILKIFEQTINDSQAKE